MPDIYGRMTTEERARYDQWIQRHWKSVKCPISGDSNWVLGDYLTQTPLYKPDSMGALSQNDSTYAILPIICSTCGYTMLVNLQYAKIVGQAGGSLGGGNVNIT